MTERWTLLVCGDRSRGDDGAAQAAIDRLSTPMAATLTVRRVGHLDPDVLVDALADGPCLIVDAVRGVEPGAIVSLPLTELGRDGASSASSHVLPLPTVVRLADVLGADLARGRFLGIGGEHFDLGAPLSPPVERGLAALAAAITASVGRGEVASCA